MADIVNDFLVSGYEADEADYQDMIDDELVEQLEIGFAEDFQNREKEMSDEVFRGLLERLKSEVFRLNDSEKQEQI